MIQHKWRMATSESELDLNYLYALGIPYPTNAFLDHSGRVPQGDGGEALHGYQHDTWTWQNMTPGQLQTLEEIVEAARTAGALYVTLPRMDGNGGTGWIDAYGKAAALDIQRRQNGLGTLVVGPVTLRINNIVIVNSPSEA